MRLQSWRGNSTMFKQVLSKLKIFFSSSPHISWIVGISIGLCVLIFILNGNSFVRPTVATVDITGIVQQFVQSQTKLNLSKSELQKRVNVFGHQLEVILQDLSSEKHLVLMPQEAVLAGSTDLTPQVMQCLEKYQETLFVTNETR